MGNEGLGLQVAVLQEHATSPSLKRVKEVALNTPTTFVKYHRGIQHLHQLADMEPKRDFKTILYILTGTRGPGKSRFCNEVADKMCPPIYYKTRGDWWDGITSPIKSVIIDGFYGWLKYDKLLKIADRYPYQVKVK